MSVQEKERNEVQTNEMNHSRCRFRHPVVSTYNGNFKTITPGIQQAYALLSPVHADAG